ncbi:hypothetical protein AAG906_010403 [Vitis piasezkii]
MDPYISLIKILERYCNQSDAEKNVHMNDYNGEKHHPARTTPGKCCDILQLMQGYVEGQNIDLMNVTDLVQLEQELDATLRRTRIRKVSFCTLHNVNLELFSSK